jgi:hypothetical protein
MMEEAGIDRLLAMHLTIGPETFRDIYHRL